MDGFFLSGSGVCARRRLRGGTLESIGVPEVSSWLCSACPSFAVVFISLSSGTDSAPGLCSLMCDSDSIHYCCFLDVTLTAQRGGQPKRSCCAIFVQWWCLSLLSASPFLEFRVGDEIA